MNFQRSALVILFCMSIFGHAAPPKRLKLFAGESKILEASNPKKMVIGNKEVADVSLLSSSEVLVNAKRPGQTSLIVWEDGGQIAYEIEVVAGGLEKTMIEVDVQVLELNNADNWDLGVDYSRVLGQGSPTAGQGQPSGPNNAVEITPPPLLAFGTFNRGPIDVLVNALVQKNKAKLLAKPRLLTISGGSASFLDGGEVPVVNQDALGKTAVEYKNYGVTLDILPSADDAGNINATVRAEVSNLDPANSVKVANGIMPALKTRWVKTTIFVKQNETIVIAGLIQEEEGKVNNGIPLLSDIPLLGELFRSTHLVTQRTELVIFMTPKILGME